MPARSHPPPSRPENGHGSPSSPTLCGWLLRVESKSASKPSRFLGGEGGGQVERSGNSFLLPSRKEIAAARGCIRQAESKRVSKPTHFFC